MYKFRLVLSNKLHNEDPQTQFDKTNICIKDKLNKITNKFTLIANITKKLNIDYYCIISIDNSKDILNLFKNDNYINNLNIYKILDFKNVFNNMNKNIIRTKNYINREPIIYDYDLNLDLI